MTTTSTPTQAEIVTLAKQGGVVLLTATKDVEHSHAPVLAVVVRDRLEA